MLQLRGLGLIDSDKIGSSTLRRPRIATGGTVETVPATSGYPVIPTSTGGTPSNDVAIMAYQVNAAQPAYPSVQPATPIVQPNAPTAQPSLPTPPPLPVPPMATNPSNPTMPAPSGTQVTMQPAEPWNPRWYKWGMSPKLWGLAALAAFGLGIGFALKRH